MSIQPKHLAEVWPAMLTVNADDPVLCAIVHPNDTLARFLRLSRKGTKKLLAEVAAQYRFDPVPVATKQSKVVSTPSDLYNYCVQVGVQPNEMQLLYDFFRKLSGGDNRKVRA